MDKYSLLFKLDKSFIDLMCLGMTVARFPFYVRNKKLRLKNENLKTYKHCNKCYILGLGPSLKNVDLSLLDGDIIATNRFVNYEDGKKITPQYYVLADKAFYDKEVKVTQKAMEKYPNTAFVFDGKYCNENDFAANINVFFAFMWQGYCHANKDMDFTKRLPQLGNVVCLAIAVAIYCGYEEIYLLGCDFNSFASQKAIHCYDEKDSNRLWSMSYELFCYSFVSDIHNELNMMALRKGLKIKNVTAGSLIDAYERDPETTEYLQKK